MHAGHLIENTPELTGIIKEIPTKPLSDFPIVSAKIKVTWNCNLKCQMCRLWQSEKSSEKPVLPVSKTKEVLSALAQQGLRKIHFSGGEVLLYPDELCELITHARSLNLQVNLTTNGTLLNKQLSKFFIRERVHTIAVSVDSAYEKEHDRTRGLKGSWKKTWQGIDYLNNAKERKGRGPKIAVNTVIHRKNIDILDDLYHTLITNKVNSWRLLPIDTELKELRPTSEQWLDLERKLPQYQAILARSPVGWIGDNSVKRLKKGLYAGGFYENNSCFAPWFNIFIDADGKVYPCCMGKQEMLPFGNILTDDMEKILSSKVRNEIKFTMASGHPFYICNHCDDYIEENKILNEIIGE